jgi:hypothetical protein
MDKELLPCPFCGTEVKLNNEYNYNEYKPYGSAIQCFSCNICMSQDHYGNPDDLIKAWNTRKPSGSEIGVEEIRKIIFEDVLSGKTITACECSICSDKHHIADKASLKLHQAINARK